MRTIALNRPESLNAMNAALIRDVSLAFDDANGDEATRAIIFTGKGRAFCAGDDRNAHGHPENEQQARVLVDAIQRATRSIVFGAKPGWVRSMAGLWAAALNGQSIAIFRSGRKVQRPSFRGSTQSVRHRGGDLHPAQYGWPLKAREMLMLGERYSAYELLEAGVAWRVVEDEALMDEAAKIAIRLASQPVLSMRAMKRVLNQVGADGINRALDLETEATVAGFHGP
ncbi:MAG: enoyl-CoA hydratase/isomerase family protein [Nitratireductor sp.]